MKGKAKHKKISKVARVRKKVTRGPTTTLEIIPMGVKVLNNLIVTGQVAV